MGWHVFPCDAEKRPLTTHGFHDATTDLATIRGWWRKWPNAAIGIACGASKLVAIDCDVKHPPTDGITNFEALGVTHDGALHSLTGSGGMHAVFSDPTGGKIRNSTSKLAPDVDVRAAGGYIIAPPSVTSSGPYIALEPWDRQPDPLPDALVQLLQPQQPAQAQQPAQPRAYAGTPSAYATAALRREIDKVRRASVGTRNNTLNAAAFSLGQLAGGGELDRATVEAELMDAALDAGLDEHEASIAIASGIGDGMLKPRSRPAPTRTASARPPEEPPTMTKTASQPLDVHQTDLGNARRLVARYGEVLRYCPNGGGWLAWDGKRWERDDMGLVERYAKATVAAMYVEAADLDDDARKALVQHALRSESAQRLRNMVTLSDSEEGIRVRPEQLDANAWLLNCANGTLDLRTGNLGPHRPTDLITKVTPVDYDPDMPTPIWDAFLARIMNDNAGLIDFLQQACGYALTGSTRERVFFILHGGGDNGKSTFLGALSEALGDYAQQTAPETLMTRARDGIPNDIARLAGARLVTASESEEGRRLAESLVKQITGGTDKLVARFLRAEFFEFLPQFKLFLATNHKPQIGGTDKAIWNRIRLVPFAVTIPKAEQDAELPDKLRAELPGILAWAVRGCLAWQRDGLSTPPEVLQATAEYRAEEDPLGKFIAECLMYSPAATAKAGELYKAYVQWMEDNGERAISGTKFGRLMTERGIDKYQDRTGVHYLGIGLLANGDKA
jgi:P4 family phage/plasmid primase-like protien